MMRPAKRLLAPAKGVCIGMTIGVVIGALVGGAGVASAAFGKKGWDRFGSWFQQGYVAGFVDCLRMAKGLDPEGYLASNYVVPPRAKPTSWQRAVNDLYGKKEHENRTLAQIMMIAGHKLGKELGYEETKTGDPRLAALRKMLEARQKALREAQEAIEIAEKETASEGGEGAAPPPEPTEGAAEDAAEVDEYDEAD